MPNPIKYSVGSESLALKKGNFWIGTGDVGKGPTSTTGYWNGVTPPAGGYTIYLNKASGGPSIYTCANDAELISLTNKIAGTSYGTANECLTYFAGQNDKVVFNRDYEEIVTDGLIFSIDPGFIPSYPRNGLTAYDLLANSINGTLINSPSFISDNGGTWGFDGTNNHILLNSNASVDVAHNDPWSTSVWVYLEPHSISSTTYNGGPFGYYGSGFKPGWYYFRQDIEAGTSNNRVRLFIREQRNPGWGAISLYPFGSTYEPPATTDGYWLNQWLNIVLTKSADREYKVYMNGVYKTGSTRSATYLDNGLSVNAIGVTTFSADLFFNGNIGPLLIYDKELSADEVLQNFDAVKGRFGL